MWQGEVVGLFLAAEARQPMRAAQQVRLVAGEGVDGDRYSDAGTWSRKQGPQRQVTLIESEALEAARRDYGLSLEPADTRRNIVTAGVALNHLVGRTFVAGAATLRGLKLCEPCSHMERLCGKTGAARALVHRGGLNAEVLTGGRLRVGDPIRPA